MSRSIHLLIIDPQNDFCDLPASYCPEDSQNPGQRVQPALPVTGAHADMQRVAALIDQLGQDISAITVTIDSHQRLDIAHPGFWVQGNGEPVAPFTQISAAAVRAGEYRPRQEHALPRVLAYLDALQASGRYVHMVWPVHCEIGSWGNNVHADVRAAYNRWEESRLSIVNKVVKGTNPWTEHYSALKAEVPDPEDDDTQLNQALLAHLQQADLVLIAGEAGSHCVRATTEHIVEHFGGDLRRLVLLTDCISPVAGFESHYAEFVRDMRARGVRTASSVELMSAPLTAV